MELKIFVIFFMYETVGTKNKSVGTENEKLEQKIIFFCDKKIAWDGTNKQFMELYLPWFSVRILSF